MKKAVMLSRAPKTEPRIYRHTKFICRRNSTPFYFLFFACPEITFLLDELVQCLWQAREGWGYSLTRLKSCLVAGWHQEARKTRHNWLLKKCSKDTQKPQVPTGSFVFYIITLIPDIYGLGHFLTQREGTYTYVKYTCEAMKIFVFLTHHDALANRVQHLQGF